MHKCEQLDKELDTIVEHLLNSFQKKFEPLVVHYLKFLKKFDSKDFVVLYEADNKDDVVDMSNKFFVIMGAENSHAFNTLKYILFEFDPIAMELDAGNDIEKEIIKKTIKYIDRIQKKLDSKMRDSFMRIGEINDELNNLGCEN